MPKLGQELHRTAPHGQHIVTYIDDQDWDDPALRLYGIEDAMGTPRGRLAFTGAELDSLLAWWQQERARWTGA